LESERLQFPQGVRAALAISVPIGLGLAFHQLATAVIVALGAWFVLIADTGGAYRQKAIATLSATAGVACAVLSASILNVSPLTRIVGTFLWVAAAAFIAVF
jgi:thiosulfate reductase cytochrome b subunit